MHITIHTPSAGVRAISINGNYDQRFTIEDCPKVAGVRTAKYVLKEYAGSGTGGAVAAGETVRALEFSLRNHLNKVTV